MDKGLIARLAREADFTVVPQLPDDPRGPDAWVRVYAGDSRIDNRLERFAALVAEECAKVCDENLRAYCERVGAPPPNMDHHSVYRSAADIRAKFGRP